MSTSFNPGQPNSGLATQSLYNLQPFSYPYPNTTYGNAGLSASMDPMQQYFGGSYNPSTDGFQAGNPLGLGNSPVTGNSGSNASSAAIPASSLPDNTILARFQGLAKKLDTEVKPEEDEKIDVNDMQTALKDTSGKYSDEDKQVIQAMLDNTNGVRGKLDHLDGEDDGVIEINSINKMVVDPNAKQQTPEAKMTNTDALNTMADYMGTAIHLDKAGHRADKYVDKHGKLVAGQRGAWTTDRGKLQRMANDDQVPEKVRTAAKKLLENQKLLQTVDTAHKGGDPDGKYSLKDFQEAINKNPDIDSIGNEESGAVGGPASTTGGGYQLPQAESIPLAETPAPAPSSGE